MIEACCAMLDMDRAVLTCLENTRSQTMADLCELSHLPPGAIACAQNDLLS